MKTCSRCKVTKPLDDFALARFESPDGRFRWCRVCAKEYRKSQRQDPEYVKRHREESLRWARENPDRIKSSYEKRLRQEQAVRLGRTPRPCDWCGRPIPVTMRTHAKYCKPSCRSATQSLKRRVKGAKPFPFLTRQEIIRRDNGICHICGFPVPSGEEHLDHVIPVAGGGTSDATNLAVAHATCNRKKGARLTPTRSR